MSTRYILPKIGTFFKANLHCHTNLSDGIFSPEQVKEGYLAHGYEIVAYTDHRICIEHSDLNDAHFLALTGSELDEAEQTPWHRACHLCCISKNPQGREHMLQLKSLDIVSVNQTIEALRKDDFIVHYNHPVWSCQTPAEYCHYKGISGFEVYNHCAEVYAKEGNALNDYALFMKSNQFAYPVAADDNHYRPNSRRYIMDSFGGFTMIKAKELTYNAVIEALEAGYVYASTGPKFYSILLNGSMLELTCSPVSKVIVKSGKVCLNWQNLIMEDDIITSARIDLSDLQLSGFVYVELFDQKGHFACSPPIRL